MDFIDLSAHIRTKRGKGPARTLRSEGRVPAVLYGPGVESLALTVEKHDLDLVLKKGNIGQILLNLKIHNGDTVTRKAMIKELQTQPVSGRYLHVDFYEVALDRKITVEIPVSTVGHAKGVELGGVLQFIRHELEVLCFPHEIPETIVVDISDLGIGDSVHVEEIPLPEGAEILADSNFTVLTVVSPKAEEEAEEAEEEGEEGEEEEGDSDQADDAEE